MRARNDAGFTLAELSVALVVAGLVALTARGIASGVLDGIAVNAAARAANDQERNGRLELQRLVGSIDVGPDRALEFVGEPHRIAFAAWSARSGVPVLGRYDVSAEGGSLVAATAGGRLTLLSGVLAFDCDYLLDAGATESWVRGWRSVAGPPLGIRFRATRATRTDTLLVYVGRRG